MGSCVYLLKDWRACRVRVGHTAVPRSHHPARAPHGCSMGAGMPDDDESFCSLIRESLQISSRTCKSVLLDLLSSSITGSGFTSTPKWAPIESSASRRFGWQGGCRRCAPAAAPRSERRPPHPRSPSPPPAPPPPHLPPPPTLPRPPGPPLAASPVNPKSTELVGVHLGALGGARPYIACSSVGQ